MLLIPHLQTDGPIMQYKYLHLLGDISESIVYAIKNLKTEVAALYFHNLLE